MREYPATPRKHVVGTTIFGPYGRHPGLEERLDELGALIDAMAAEAEAKWDRGLDLAVLPEDAVCGGRAGAAEERSVALEGPVLPAMGRKAREHGTYVVLPLFMVEDEKRFRNAAVLIDRQGRKAGVYRKVHPVIDRSGRLLEGGVIPGSRFPLFECDFGRIGIQICLDMSYADGWRTLSKNGAEIIAWPSQSPQTVRPAARALEGGCYIVSSTWRNNASIFEPTGLVVSRIEKPGEVLVQEIDLSYVILPWSEKLRNGEYLRGLYGQRIGYRYSESEDCGIFWSNDPSLPIRRMVEEAGLEDLKRTIERNRKLQDELRTKDEPHDD